jgi:hypothetical protein
MYLPLAFKAFEPTYDRLFAGVLYILCFQDGRLHMANVPTFDIVLLPTSCGAIMT